MRGVLELRFHLDLEVTLESAHLARSALWDRVSGGAVRYGVVGKDNVLSHGYNPGFKFLDRVKGVESS